MRGSLRLVAIVALLAGCTTEFDPGLLDAAARDAGRRDGGDGGSLDGGDAGLRDAGLDGGPDGGPPPCPAVRLVEGTAVVAPVEPGPRPARGETFRDPSFGTCITRISDAEADGYIGHVSPVVRGVLDPSANRAPPLMDSYRHHLYDLETRSHVSALALYSHQRVRFSAVDDTFWQLAEPFTLVRSTLSGTERARVDLGPAIGASIPDGTRMEVHPRSASADDARWALTVDTSAGRDRALVTVAMPEGAIVGARRWTDAIPDELRRVRAGISPGGRFVALAVAQEEVGPVRLLEVYTADLATRVLAYGEADGIGAWDFARDAAGRDVLVYTRGPELVVADLEMAGAPTRVVLDELGDGALDPRARRSLVVVSGAAYDRPGWVVLSFAICRDNEGTDCPPGALWAQDKLVLVSIDETPRVLNVAWHRSALGGSRHPHALPSRDLTRIVFESTWGDAGTAEVYLIELPADAIGAP